MITEYKYFYLRLNCGTSMAMSSTLTKPLKTLPLNLKCIRYRYTLYLQEYYFAAL